MVYDESAAPGAAPVMVDPADATRRKSFSDERIRSTSCLVPVFRGGERLRSVRRAGIEAARARALSSVGELDPSITRFLNPHTYPVGLEQQLNDVRTALVLAARGLGS